MADVPCAAERPWHKNNSPLHNTVDAAHVTVASLLIRRFGPLSGFRDTLEHNDEGTVRRDVL